MCVMQANSFSDQIKIFQNHFYNFFKFHKDNLTGLKEVVKTRNELSTTLAKKGMKESNLKNRKEIRILYALIQEYSFELLIIFY